MKKIALSLLVALACITAKAENGKSLYVNFNDGQKVEFALAKTPEVTFGNNQMTIKTTEATTTYELTTVASFTYNADATGISKTETDNKLAWEGNRIIVDGTNNKVHVYTIDGKNMGISPIVTGSKTILNLDSLTKGIYIIKINNKSFKIARQ